MLRCVTSSRVLYVSRGAIFSGKVRNDCPGGVIAWCFPWANVGISICAAASAKPVSERKKALHHFLPPSQQYKSRIKLLLDLLAPGSTARSVVAQP